jgi:hypothetical protein
MPVLLLLPLTHKSSMSPPVKYVLAIMAGGSCAFLGFSLLCTTKTPAERFFVHTQAQQQQQCGWVSGTCW